MRRMKIDKWSGLNQAVEPHLLEPGQLQEAYNLDMSQPGILRPMRSHDETIESVSANGEMESLNCLEYLVRPSELVPTAVVGPNAIDDVMTRFYVDMNSELRNIRIPSDYSNYGDTVLETFSVGDILAINDERIRIDGVGDDWYGNYFIVTRGVGGTTPAAHPNYSTVRLGENDENFEGYRFVLFYKRGNSVYYKLMFESTQGIETMSDEVLLYDSFIRAVDGGDSSQECDGDLRVALVAGYYYLVDGGSNMKWKPAQNGEMERLYRIDEISETVGAALEASSSRANVTWFNNMGSPVPVSEENDPTTEDGYNYDDGTYTIGSRHFVPIVAVEAQAARDWASYVTFSTQEETIAEWSHGSGSASSYWDFGQGLAISNENALNWTQYADMGYALHDFDILSDDGDWRRVQFNYIAADVSDSHCFPVAVYPVAQTNSGLAPEESFRLGLNMEYRWAMPSDIMWGSVEMDVADGWTSGDYEYNQPRRLCGRFDYTAAFPELTDLDNGPNPGSGDDKTGQLCNRLDYTERSNNNWHPVWRVDPDTGELFAYGDDLWWESQEITIVDYWENLRDDFSQNGSITLDAGYYAFTHEGGYSLLYLKTADSEPWTINQATIGFTTRNLDPTYSYVRHIHEFNNDAATEIVYDNPLNHLWKLHWATQGIGHIPTMRYDGIPENGEPNWGHYYKLKFPPLCDDADFIRASSTTPDNGENKATEIEGLAISAYASDGFDQIISILDLDYAIPQMDDPDFSGPHQKHSNAMGSDGYIWAYRFVDVNDGYAESLTDVRYLNPLDDDGVPEPMTVSPGAITQMTVPLSDDPAIDPETALWDYSNVHVQLFRGYSVASLFSVFNLSETYSYSVMKKDYDGNKTHVLLFDGLSDVQVNQGSLLEPYELDEEYIPINVENVLYSAGQLFYSTGNQLSWSKYYLPDAFSASRTLKLDSNITGLSALGGDVLVFTAGDIFRYRPIDEVGVIVNTKSEHGAISGDAVYANNTIAFMAHEDALYAFGGQSSREITSQVQDSYESLLGGSVDGIKMTSAGDTVLIAKGYEGIKLEGAGTKHWVGVDMSLHLDTIQSMCNTPDDRILIAGTKTDADTGSVEQVLLSFEGGEIGARGSDYFMAKTGNMETPAGASIRAISLESKHFTGEPLIQVDIERTSADGKVKTDTITASPSGARYKERFRLPKAPPTIMTCITVRGKRADLYSVELEVS